MRSRPVGSAEHLPLQHLDLVVEAPDGAGAVGRADPGDDRVEVLAETGDETVQGRQLVGLDTLDPLPELRTLAVVHQLGGSSYIDLRNACPATCWFVIGMTLPTSAMS
ncbi:hypothetical protein STRCI_008204 [Streptomyces cinnabarinus]|uniref:Uncharacterized protein n=1 Tax=Streptomyces cinnabarinus TaxID=67287 RepID=A0ABY7KPW7_9ACTN|nr:hypothetical protein [Streptomyces cinnabarinus]WAZ26609.1 hypothetical protein STRCI_008204 [Streptomyces cinnabarinus]